VSSFYVPGRLPAGRLGRCVAGLLVFLAATLLRIALDPLLTDQAPFLIHVAGVALAAWVGGVEGGICAAIASSGTVDYLFIPPRYELGQKPLDHLAGMLLFGAVSTALVWQVSRWRRAEQSLQESRADLNRAQGVSRTGSWRLDVRRNGLSWSDETYRMFGTAPGTPLQYESFLSAVHPGDREAVDRAWQGGMNGKTYDIDHRIVVGGNVRWVHERAELELDSEGRLIGGFGTVQDITDRKVLEETLQANTQRLREANRLKDEFLATLSHELRTPLNAIVGWSQMLLSGGLDGGAQRHALEVIARNARAQTQLVEEVLDVSRVIAGSLRLTLQPVNIRSVVERALDAVRPAAAAKQLRIDVSIECDEAIVADAERLQQVAWNLLSNAVKFTPEGGSVRLEGRRVDGRVEIEVSDTGIGIPAAFLPHVFERFTQADSSRSRVHGGLGLGLAIVRHIVELHGGTVAAASEGEGKGARFTISLPVRSASTGLQAPGPAHERLAPDAAPKQAVLDGLRVLVVDDDADTREVIQTILRAAGAGVSAAPGAREAMDAIQQQPPNVLISDIGMPGEDGYQFIRRVRSLGGPEAGVFAIALTAYGQAGDRAQALAAGYDQHVAKPILPRELVTVVGSVLRRLVREQE
jgi:PAS domain S-box-containing protein